MLQQLNTDEGSVSPLDDLSDELLRFLQLLLSRCNFFGLLLLLFLLRILVLRILTKSE